jgi:hypothetical protein
MNKTGRHRAEELNVDGQALSEAIGCRKPRETVLGCASTSEIIGAELGFGGTKSYLARRERCATDLVDAYLIHATPGVLLIALGIRSAGAPAEDYEAGRHSS